MDKVLDHGHDGPAVIMWVTCTLMCMAAREDSGKRIKRGEVRRADDLHSSIKIMEHGLYFTSCVTARIYGETASLLQPKVDGRKKK